MLGLLILFSYAAAIITAIGTLLIIHRLRHPPRTGYGLALSLGRPAEPADLGLAAQERLFHLTKGATSPGWIIEGQNHEPGAPVVIVTHGWGDSRTGALVWAGMLAPLAAAVVLYDLRAHGDSSAKRSDLGTTEADDLLAIVDQIDAGLGPVVLMGYSIGAGISIAAAAEAARHGTAERIAGVIGEGVYRWGMEPIYGFFRFKGWPLYPFLWLVGAHLEVWVRRSSLFERARHAAAMTCPLLLLHGTADPVCRFRSAQEIAAAARDGTLVAFEGGGHLDLLSREPEKYREALTAFLARVRVARPEPRESRTAGRA